MKKQIGITQNFFNACVRDEKISKGKDYTWIHENTFIRNDLEIMIIRMTEEGRIDRGGVIHFRPVKYKGLPCGLITKLNETSSFVGNMIFDNNEIVVIE